MSFMSTQSIAVLTATLSLAAACTEPEPVRDPEPDPPVLQLIEERLGPKPQTFTVDGATGGAIRGNSTTLEIPAGAIVVPGARTPATGPIEIALREYESVGDMVRGGLPTIDDDGQLLTSSGSFDLSATDARGQAVDVLKLKDVLVRAWEPEPNPLMEAWVAGARADTWALPNPNVPALFVDHAYWLKMINVPPQQRQVAGSGSVVQRARINVDTYMSSRGVRGLVAPDLMTLAVQLDEELATNAGVFFLPEGGTVAAKLTTYDPALPGYVSGTNAMPTGVTGTLIVVALVDGTYYLQHDESFVIPPGVADAAGSKLATIHASPVEVSEADFMAYLASL